MIYCCLMTTFSEWLQAELNRRGWMPSDMVQAGGPKLPTLGRILNQERGVGGASVRKIARALSLPEDYVMRKAGLLSPARTEDDPTSLKRLMEVARQLSDEDREELTYIALGKQGRHAAKATSS